MCGCGFTTPGTGVPSNPASRILVAGLLADSGVNTVEAGGCPPQGGTPPPPVYILKGLLVVARFLRGLSSPVLGIQLSIGRTCLQAGLVAELLAGEAVRLAQQLTEIAKLPHTKLLLTSAAILSADVGLYGNNGFVHIDTGPFRRWDDANVGQRRPIPSLSRLTPDMLHNAFKF